MGTLFSSEEEREEFKTKWQPSAVENTMLSWIAIASIFFVLSGTANNLSSNTMRSNKYFIAFTIIGFIILVITAFDYMSVRRKMKLRGRSPYTRTDYLFVVLLATISIVGMVILEALLAGENQNDVDSNSNKQCKNKYEDEDTNSQNTQSRDTRNKNISWNESVDI